MLLEAIPMVGRATIAFDPQVETVRNYVRDPRFQNGAMPGWTIPATWSRVDGTGAWKRLVLTGTGAATLAVLTVDAIAPLAYAWVEITIASTSMPLELAVTSVGTGAVHDSRTVTTAGTYRLQAIIGADGVAQIWVNANAAGTVTVSGVHMLSANVEGFTGDSADTGSRLYRWSGTAYASPSLRIARLADAMTLWRDDGTSRVPVRGVVGVPAGPVTVSDNDVPLRRGVHYVMTLSDGTWVESNTIVVQPADPLLTDRESWPILSDPVTGESARVVIVEWDEWTYSNESKLVHVPRRPDPIVVGDIEAAPESTVVLLTLTAADAARVEALAATGETLLLRSPCPGILDAWIHHTSRKLARVGRKASAAARLHTLDVVQVTAPDMTVRGAGNTLGGIAAAVQPDGGTLGHIAARWGSLGAIAADDLVAVW